MAHQCGPDALPLEFVDHSERDLSRSGLHDDVASAADNHLSAAFFHHRYQSDMVDEVDIHVKRDFLFRETASDTEETAIERLVAGAADRFDEAGLIVWSECADFDPASIAQHFGR